MCSRPNPIPCLTIFVQSANVKKITTIVINFYRSKENFYELYFFWTKGIEEASLNIFTFFVDMKIERTCVARGGRFGSNLKLTKACHFLGVRPLLVKQT